MTSADRLVFVNHKGKQVLVLDFTNCTPEEVKDVSEEARRVIATQPNDSLLVLADFTGAQFTKDAVTRMKEVTTLNRPFVKRAAWVHTESLPKVFYNAIRNFSQREFPTFETRQQALEFLVED